MKVLLIVMLLVTVVLGALYLNAALDYHNRPPLEVISH